MVDLFKLYFDKKIKNIILDLDNCVFDSREWEKYIPKDGSRDGWDLYHKHYDLVKPNPEMEEFIEDLIYFYGLERIYFVTSREDKGVMRNITEKQILNAFSDTLDFDKIKISLFMRNENDYRPSYLVKQDILCSRILPFKKIDLAIDDDIDNINMYKSYNIQTIYYDKFLLTDK